MIASGREDVSIIGMACMFPGAPDLDTFWDNIVGKVDAVGDPPPGWGPDEIFAPESRENDRIYCRRGGFLRDIARFDPLRSGVMPASIEGAEPDHFLALRLAEEAMNDAGYASRQFPRERTAVILGRGEYFNRGNVTALQHGIIVGQTIEVLRQCLPECVPEALTSLKAALKAALPPFGAETAPGLVPNVLAGRIANRLDLMGPNYTVDAACASAMIAVENGIQQLTTGHSDLAIVGGVHASTPPIIFMVFCQLNALSKNGCIRPFDSKADGTILGEGLGLLVIKRKKDAERDGDRIYANIRGVGVASDGRALGVLAPRIEGEELALRRAYDAADVDPDTIELIEAHGTGTPVGDATELEALKRVFGKRSARHGKCAIGSVKSMIGHTMPAAGAAGIIKCGLSLYHKVLPPSIHCDEPHRELGLEDSPLHVNTETLPWIHGRADAPRRAGVSAFGFGGINAHVVLEEACDAD